MFFYWILSRWTLNFFIVLLWLPLFWTRSLQSNQHNLNYNLLKVLSMCFSLVTSLTFLYPCTFCCNQVRNPPNVFVGRMCTLIVLYFLLWGRGQRESFFQSRDENENFSDSISLIKTRPRISDTNLSLREETEKKSPPVSGIEPRSRFIIFNLRHRDENENSLDMISVF